MEHKSGFIYEKTYYKNGNVESKISYVNGILNGTHRTYHENGSVMTSHQSIDNAWLGIYMYWEIGGTRLQINNYKLDFIEHGPKIDFRYEK